MTTRTVIQDDIDHSEPAEAVSFSYQGDDYTIDLGVVNKKKLEGLLAPWIDKAHRTGIITRPVRRQASKVKVDYATLEHCAELHRGRITEAEAQLVRANRQIADDNRKRQTESSIDWDDPKEKNRYGL